MLSSVLPALGLVLAAALLAGCAPTPAGDSVDDFRGTQRQVAQTIEDLQSAGTDSDQAKICRELLARALVTRLASGGRGCEAAVASALDDTDSMDMTVESVRVNGTRATARVRLETGDSDRRTTIPLVRESNRWKIADLTPAAGQ